MDRRTDLPLPAPGTRDGALEQVDAFSRWVRHHPLAGLVIIVLAMGGIFAFFNPNRPITPEQLGVGDCLEVAGRGTVGSSITERPVAGPEEAARIVMTGAAILAACGAPHSHEVSEVISLDAPNRTPPPAVLRAELSPRCEAAFVPYVGRALAGSAYVTFVAIPVGPQLTTGPPVALCLVTAADGRWMTAPARGSGR